jgi:uncharacterized small protein (DUF1192 family)
MSIDFESDAQAIAVADNSLAAVAELGRKALLLEKDIEDLEATLSEKKEALRNLTDERIPDALKEIGMLKFAMADGSEIEVKPFYSASIPVDRRGEAYEWLRAHGFDDIIKNTVSVQFGRGEDDAAGELISAIRQQGLLPEQAEKIESQTLKAWVREMVEKGTEFPTELFGAYTGFKAKIKRAK